MTTLDKGATNDAIAPSATSKQGQGLNHVYDELDFSGPRVRDVMLRNFSSIDTDKDGLISQTEMDSYKPAPEDASVHRYVRLRVDEIETLQRESFFGDSKISRNDLQQFAISEASDRTAAMRRYYDYSTVFADNFKRLDTDSNELVSKQELDQAEFNPKYDVGAKQMIRFFKENYNPIESGLSPAFMPKGSGLDVWRVDETGEIFDFNSKWSNKYTRLSLPISGIVGGAAGGALILWRFSGLASRMGIPVTSTTFAIAAGIGAAIAGGYMFATAVQQEKTIPETRLALYNSLSRELSDGTASPIAGSQELAKKYPERIAHKQEPAQKQEPTQNQEPKQSEYNSAEKPPQTVETPDFRMPKSQTTGMPNASTRALFRELEK